MLGCSGLFADLKLLRNTGEHKNDYFQEKIMLNIKKRDFFY